MVETVAECLLLPAISKHSACGLEENRVCIRAWSAMLESQTRIECNPCHGMHESHAAFLAENSRPTKIKENTSAIVPSAHCTPYPEFKGIA